MLQLARMLGAAAVLSLLIAGAASADSDVIKKKSAHDVATTLDRLEKIVKDKGMGVAARVDHGAAAARVGMQLRPTQLLIFGNPKVGTKLMQINQEIGLALPMKVLAWQDKDGQTWIGYVDPEEMAEDFGIDEDNPVIKKIKKALAGLTNAAAKE